MVTEKEKDLNVLLAITVEMIFGIVSLLYIIIRGSWRIYNMTTKEIEDEENQHLLHQERKDL